jgi:hypothetical protein
METTLYNGKVKIEFTEGSHRYKINGKSGCPSVTSVTGLLNKPALLFWSANLARDFMLEHLRAGTLFTEELIMEAAKQHTIRKEQAATSGTMVHKWASDYIKGEKPEMPDDENVLRGVTAFLNWVDEHGVKFMASEQIVYSKKHDYVGIMDCKFTLKSEKHKIPHCGDFKTSSGIYPEMYAQVSAYQEADAEESGCEYGDKWIIRFDKKDGTFEARSFPLSRHAQDFGAFLGLLSAKRWLDDIKKQL